MEPIDYIALQELYGGKHIAVQDEKVIASADNLGALVSELKAKGLPLEDVVFEFVRPKGMACAY